MPPRENTADKHLLHFMQALPTSGARAVQPFELDGHLYIAVPQLAADKPLEPPSMNGGNSDIDLILFRNAPDRFEEVQRLAVSGGEDAEFFRIGERAFLATASLRTGSGPYELDAVSTVFEWVAGAFLPFQDFPTFAAKQWRHFQIGRRHFLALAQGVVLEGITPKAPSKSTIFEWDGNSFLPFQEIPSGWGYNWCHFQLGGQDFLAYADHVEPSAILRWNGAAFVPFQTLDGASGRAFCFFTAGGDAYLAFANLLGDTLLYRWNGLDFARHQTLSGPGGREFATLEHEGVRYLIQANFLTGTPKAPTTHLQSIVYRMDDGELVVAETFPTFGATDVAVFTLASATCVAVAESLSADIRFRTDSRIYRFGPR